MRAWREASSRPARRRLATSAACRRASRAFVAEACVGCMACVSACPDNAIFATVQPQSAVATAIGEFAGGEPDPQQAILTARGTLRQDDEVRGRPRAERTGAWRVRHIRRSRPLQGLRGVRRGLSRARPRRTRDGRQGTGHRRRRGDTRALYPRHAPLPDASADAAAVSQREGARRPHARRTCPRLRRRCRVVLGMR